MTEDGNAIFWSFHQSYSIQDTTCSEQKINSGVKTLSPGSNESTEIMLNDVPFDSVWSPTVLGCIVFTHIS